MSMDSTETCLEITTSLDVNIFSVDAFLYFDLEEELAY